MIRKFLVLILTTFLLVSFVGCNIQLKNKPTTSKNGSIGQIKEWLDKDCSFEISYMYMNLANNGISAEISQSFAKDGSFHFLMESRQWDHAADYESKDKMEYYYRYEDKKLVCYQKHNDGDTQRTVLTNKAKKEMNTSKSMMVGSKGLLPEYLENFKENKKNAETGQRCFSFSLPVKEVINNDTLLSSYIQNAFSLFGSEYDSKAQIDIICNIVVEEDSLRPVKISYDFKNLEPYVLSEGALSGEAALETEFMYMVYEFDYDTLKTVTIPNGFIK